MKVKAIFEVETKKRPPTDVANEIGVPISTLCTWTKKAASIKEQYHQSRYVKTRKTYKQSKMHDIDVALLDWITLMKGNKVALNTKLVQKKGKQLARLLGYTADEFKSSIGWVTRFRKRYGLSTTFDVVDK